MLFWCGKGTLGTPLGDLTNYNGQHWMLPFQFNPPLYSM